MNRISRRTLTLAIGILGALALAEGPSTHAIAAPITYDLVGATLNGEALTGGFTYNEATSTLSAVNIYSAYLSHTYTERYFANNGNTYFTMEDTSGNTLLTLNFLGILGTPLTDSTTRISSRRFPSPTKSHTQPRALLTLLHFRMHCRFSPLASA